MSVAESRRPAFGTAFRLGEWSVSPDTNCVEREAVKRQMEPRAMEVLVALCQRAGAIISADELLAQCWGTTVYGDNPVHKIIAQLRQVLGDNATSPTYIETIRKRGYRTLAAVTFDQPELNGSGPSGKPAWHDGSPFRGLQAFDEEHAQVFFGRAQTTHALVEAIRAQVNAGFALQLLLGPSGSGKTSLIRAGLFPALSAENARRDLALLATTAFDLGEQGEHSLFTALAGTLLDLQCQDAPVFPGASATSLAQRLEYAMDTVLEEMHTVLVAQSLAKPGRRLRFGVFIDRFEALFNFNRIAESERRAFLAVLERLARSNAVVVVIGCRNDFYPHIAGYPLLMEGKQRGGHFDLTAPSYAEIAQIIRLPARAANLTFGIDARSQASLDDVLCQSAASSPDALPLLQYCLQELYRLRTPEGQLSFAAFEHLGGIEGAIGSRAEQVVSVFTDEQRASLARVMSLVVVISADEDSVTSQRAPLSLLRSDSERQVVNALVESRLFVSELMGAVPGFGVAHEAILRRWPRMTEWIEAHRSALRIRGRLAQLTVRWVRDNRSNDLLLPRGKQLSEAKSLEQGGVFALSVDEQALIAMSSKRARRREQLRTLAVGMIAVLAVLATGLGITSLAAKRVADQRRMEAEGLMGFMLGDFADKLRPLGKLDLLDDVSSKALQYLTDPQREDVSAISQTQRAKALQAIGEVSRARGEPQNAITALSNANAILLGQYQLAPQDTEVLRNLGANAFWLGQIALDQNDWSQAADHFERYRAFSERLNALQPDVQAWWIEQSYAHNSLGSLALKRGATGAAVREFSISIALKQRALNKTPQNATLAAELADSYSWLATAKESLGELEAAAQLYERELQIVRQLHETAPSEALWVNRHALALQHVAALELARGNDRQALNDYRAAKKLLIDIVRRDVNNRAWQQQLANVELEEQRIVMRLHNAKGVPPELLKTHSSLMELVALNPGNAVWARMEAIARQRIAAALLAEQRVVDAYREVKQARSALEKLYQRNRSNFRNRLAVVDSLLLFADIEGALKQPDTLRVTCGEAYALLQNDGMSSTDFHVLDPWIRVNYCLKNLDAVAASTERLANIGYRDTEYLRYLATHH